MEVETSAVAKVEPVLVPVACCCIGIALAIGGLVAATPIACSARTCAGAALTTCAVASCATWAGAVCATCAGAACATCAGAACATCTDGAAWADCHFVSVG